MKKQNKITKHKRCPCCGGMALEHITDFHGCEISLPLPKCDNLNIRYIIRCNSCGIQTPAFMFAQEAWKVWDRRIDDFE